MINKVAKGTRKGRPLVFPRYKIKCVYCRKEFVRMGKEIERYKRNYCSRKCYQKHKRLTSLGKNNSNWRGGISLVNRSSSGGGNKNYRKGRYYENKIRKEFEKRGFYTIRSAASKGVWDLVAINRDFIILVQSKSNARPIPKERKAMESFVCPKNSIKQYWRFFGEGNCEINTWDGKEWKKEIIKRKTTRRGPGGKFIKL